MSLMQAIVKIATTLRVSWDKIPEKVIQKYDRELGLLERTESGRSFKKRSIDLYNQLFAPYGYTKSY